MSSIVVPSSIERLARFPPSALALLNLVPPRQGELEQLGVVLEGAPYLLAAIEVVADREAGRVTGTPQGYKALLGRLGPGKLVEIAITILVRDYMQRAFQVYEDRRYWRYTVACAVSCAEIAAGGEDDRLVAYVGGLLHDIGRLALIAAYPDKYANLLLLTDRMFRENPTFNILEHERLLYGLDHFATGSWLAASWGLPQWLRALTGKFDEAGSGEHKALVATIRSGTRLAHSLGFGYLKAAPRAEIREILEPLPGAWQRWQTLDYWKHGEELMRGRIDSQLKLYAVAALEED